MQNIVENFSLSDELVNEANWYYGKDNPYWNCQSNDDRPDPQDDWYQVVRDFVCESGPEPREFKDNAFITKSLRNTSFIEDTHFRYYRIGQKSGRQSFNIIENFNPFFSNPEYNVAPVVA